MKKIIFIICICFRSIIVHAQTPETFHDFMGIGILGDTINFADYAGKKVLVVNTASFCAYTPQFADLALLDSLYSGPDFAIIGFPCNDFGGQDPNSDSTIYTFCTSNYNVAFQMMSKISITAPDTAEVYKWLQLQSRNGVADAPVTWNFNKYCIDELGHWVHHFTTSTNPMDTAITNWINSPVALGIAAPQDQAEFKLIENPVKDKITVRVNVKTPALFTIDLFDTKGILMQPVFNGEISGAKTLVSSVKNLSKGLYFLRISGSSETKVFKIVVAD